MAENPDELIKHPLIRGDPEECYSKTIESFITVETEKGDKVFGIAVYRKPSQEAVKEIRIELTQENDIFYVASKTFTEEQFNQKYMKDKKKVKFNFDSFMDNIEKVIANVNGNRTAFSAHFENNILKFKQKLQYKKVDLFDIEFDILKRDDEYTEDQAQFRFNQKQTKCDALKESYAQLLDFVKKNNKQLYTQITRGQDFNATRTMK